MATKLKIYILMNYINLLKTGMILLLPVAFTASKKNSNNAIGVANQQTTITVKTYSNRSPWWNRERFRG